MFPPVVVVKGDTVADGVPIHKDFSPLTRGHGHYSIVMIYHIGMVGLDAMNVKKYIFFIAYPLSYKAFTIP